MSSSADCDVAIVGGGLVGLSLAVALAGSGLKLGLIEPRPPLSAGSHEGWDSRVYALSPGSASFLDGLDIWPQLPHERVTRVEGMEIFGDDGTSRLEFNAYDAGLRELAFIVEGRQLQQALWRAAQNAVTHCYCPADCASLDLGLEQARITLADGSTLAARLVVGADGADSRVRTHAGIAVSPVDYGQLAVVANFSCEKAHDAIARQWFRRDGVLALLPLPGDRVSMVWSTARENALKLLALPAPELVAEVAVASRDVLGALGVITPAAAFPLKLQRVSRFIRPRVALVGDAAHNVHPLAGQGVNLGFRDARVLAATLSGREGRYDCGEHALLRRYERARKEDVAAMQWTTHGLQKLFSAQTVLVGRVRNAGLNLVNLQPQLKNFLVRQAVA